MDCNYQFIRFYVFCNGIFSVWYNLGNLLLTISPRLFQSRLFCQILTQVCD
jgi:hypothetical protein